MEIQKLKALIVDDSSSTRSVMIKECQLMGVKEIFDFEDPMKAWGWINQEGNDIDLILSDWNMPGMTGIDFLKLVKQSEKTKNIPFIIVTSEISQSSVTQALMAKVDGYIVKPFKPESFKSKINDVIQKYYGK